MTTRLCPWCRESFEAVRRGNQVKRFCCTAHANSWNGAARAYGRLMEELGMVSLRSWWDARSGAVHGEGETNDDANLPTEEGDAP